MSDVENQIISSKFVKEIAKLNGNINKFLTKSAIKVLKKNLMKNFLFIINIFYYLTTIICKGIIL